MLQDNKQAIQRRFNNASATYHAVDDIQKKSGDVLYSLLLNQCPDFYPRSVLDIGSGHGYMVTRLSRSFPDSLYYGNDIAENMLAGNHSHIKLNGDMETVDFPQTDLVVSNLAFQWACNLKSLLQKAYQHSHVLAFSCLLKPSFSQWANLFRNSGLPNPVYPYPDCEVLMQMMETLKPKRSFVHTETWSLVFDNPLAVMQYFKHLGASVSAEYIPIHGLKKILQQQSAPLTLTYHIFFGILENHPSCEFLSQGPIQA